MTGGPSARASEQSTSFLVDERPVVFVGDLVIDNANFLASIDPSFWRYQADAHGEALASDSSKRNAAVALRIAYGAGVETLLGLLCALVQAPHFPLGWMTSYKNPELRAVVRKIARSEPLYTRVPAGPITWTRLAAIVLERLPADLPNRGRIISGFGKAWENVAEQYLDEYFELEYNSLKHGMRGTSGTLSVTLSGDPETGAGALSGQSDHAIAFAVRDQLDGTRHSHSLRHVIRAWRPHQWIAGLPLLSMSITNVVSALQRASVEKRTAAFEWPEDFAHFDEPWSVNDASGIGQVVRAPNFVRRFVEPTRESVVAGFRLTSPEAEQ